MQLTGTSRKPEVFTLINFLKHCTDATEFVQNSEILMQNWETALEDLNRLKDVIESNVSISVL